MIIQSDCINNSLIAIDGDKSVSVSEFQIMKWNEEIDKQEMSLFPDTGRFWSSKTKEILLRNKIQDLINNS